MGCNRAIAVDKHALGRVVYNCDRAPIVRITQIGRRDTFVRQHPRRHKDGPHSTSAIRIRGPARLGAKSVHELNGHRRAQTARVEGRQLDRAGRLHVNESSEHPREAGHIDMKRQFEEL